MGFVIAKILAGKFKMITKIFSAFFQKHLGRFLKIDQFFVFWVSLFFYFLLYFNLNNKTLLGIFLIFLFILFLKFRDYLIALSILYLLFLPIAKGKTFNFELIPAWLLGTEVSYTYDFTITFSDLAFLGLLALIIRKEIVDRWRINKLKPEKNDLFLFAFIFCVFTSIFFSQFQIISFLAFLRLARVVAAYFLLQRLLFEQKLRRLIPLVLASSLIFQGVWSSLQFLFQRPLGRAIEPYGALLSAYGYMAAEEKTFFRAQGTFEHPNVLGSFFVMFLAFVLVQIFGPFRERKRKILLISYLFGLAGLAFSASRASWGVALLISSLIVVFLRHHQRKLTLSPLIKRWLVMVSLFLLIFFPFLVSPRLGHLYLTLAEKGGAYYRTYLLEKAWFLSQESPLGVGLATFPAVLIRKFGFFTWPSPVHNLFLEILVETGIFSLIFFLLFLIFTYKRFFYNLRDIKDQKNFFLKTGALFASLGFLGVAQFYPFFWASTIFEYFWLFLGVMLY